MLDGNGILDCTFQRQPCARHYQGVLDQRQEDPGTESISHERELGVIKRSKSTEMTNVTPFGMISYVLARRFGA